MSLEQVVGTAPKVATSRHMSNSTLKVIELMVPLIVTLKTNPLQERHTREGDTLSPYTQEKNSAAKLIPTYIAPGGLLPKLKPGMNIYLVVPAETVCSERVYVASLPVRRGGTVIDAEILASKFSTSSVASTVKSEDSIIVAVMPVSEFVY